MMKQEILNSFYVDKKETKKSLTSKKVSEATYNKDSTNPLSVDEVLEAYKIYDEGNEVTKKQKMSSLQKKELLFFLLGALIIAILLTAVIVIGVLIF